MRLKCSTFISLITFTLFLEEVSFIVLMNKITYIHVLHLDVQCISFLNDDFIRSVLFLCVSNHLPVTVKSIFTIQIYNK